MRIAVRYFTRGGNTRKVAEAIAAAVSARALPMDTPVTEAVDLLFLGASVYAGGVDAAVKTYIGKLPVGLVGKVAVFSTAAVKTSAYPQLQKLLAQRGIAVSAREFHCRGQFAAFHKGRPNEQDLQSAAAFARACVEDEA